MNPIYRNITHVDWMTLFLVISLTLLVLSKYFFKSSFFTFMSLPLNNKYLMVTKKKGKMVHGFHLLMSGFQIINLALFLFISQSIFSSKTSLENTGVFALIAIGIVLFFLVKIVLQIGNGYFFENYGLMTDLIFEKLTYFNYGGLIAFIGNILLIYVFGNNKPFVYVIILLVLAINCIGIINILRNHQKLILSNGFYFILYLCTLEIAPIAIIISYLIS